MRLSTLILRSLFFHRRTNLSVAAGVAVTAAVLVGALVVGDSVRYSLRAITQARLGKTRLALVSADRFFTAALAERIAESLDADTAPLFLLEGVVSAGGGAKTAVGVQMVGIDESFWRFAPSPAPIALAGDEAAINRELAERLGVEPGDEIILRVRKLSFLPLEAPFAPSASETTAIRARVAAVAGPQDFGRFSLKANHITPPTVFVPLARLSELMEMPDLANVILAARPDKPLNTEEAAAALGSSWRPADAAIELRVLRQSGAVELRSRRVFIDRAVAEAALEAGSSGRGILSYFVNELSANGRSTPYSLVSAPGAPVVPDGTHDDEIVINEWLAEDLQAAPGDELTLKYYVISQTGRLAERSSSFTVRAVVPTEGPAADRMLMPDFPGVAEAETTGDWDPGVPVDLSRIRPKDEAYWDTYRGTPKAFVALAAAERMWANRFGELTAIRLPGTDADAVSAAVMARLEPASLGLVWANVRAEGLKAASSGVDFGELFLGLSFFIVVAALVLTALLFVLSADERAGETGVLAAVGFRRRTIRRLLLAEAALLAVIGAVVGSFAAVLYDKAVLYALSTIWRGAVMTSSLEVKVHGSTLLAGGALSAAVAIIAIWIALVGRRGTSPAELAAAAPGDERVGEGRPIVSLVLGVVSLASALALVALVDPARSRKAAGAFFAGGSLLLVSGAAFFNALFARLAPAGSARLTLASMGVHNIARRRVRSLAMVLMLACGVFLVVAVGANRRGAEDDAQKRSSGTGGFRFYMETTIPVVDDLNDPAVRRSYGFTGDRWRDVSFVGMRLREGDDASCFNLNRTSRPRILGVDPRALAERGAFTFTDTALEAGARSPWLLLDAKPAEGVVAAAADETVIIWGLGKEVGGALEYVDESGEGFRAKLVGGIANSVLQGNIIISEGAFVRRFPSISGRRVFLVDAPAPSAPDVRAALERTLADFGVTVTPAAERLAAFNTVENTYLSIFLALGGLGLALGSVGMGVVVVRNVLERRSELALLRAVGFSRGALLKLLLWEHWLLLAAGLLTGSVSAAVAVLPAVLSPGTSIPYATIALVISGVAASGAAWVWIATRLAIRGDLLAALRRE